MALRIRYMDSALIVSEELWAGNMKEAKTIARNAVQSNECETVEIRNDVGDLVWRYPTTRDDR